MEFNPINSGKKFVKLFFIKWRKTYFWSSVVFGLLLCGCIKSDNTTGNGHQIKHEDNDNQFKVNENQNKNNNDQKDNKVTEPDLSDKKFETDNFDYPDKKSPPKKKNKSKSEDKENIKNKKKKLFCGDKIISPEIGEHCEPGLPLKHTCKKLGYQGGCLNCRKNCKYDYSGCVKRRQIYRRGRGSCPYIYLWNGQKHYYYGDLSGSVLGYGLKFLKPQYYGENIYELGKYKAVKGRYTMKLREVIYESSFFDKVLLYVVDLPKGYKVFNLWSFTSQLNRKPRKDFVTVKNLRAPVSAVSAKGKNVLKEISQKDGIPMPVDKSDLSRVVVDFGPLKNPEHTKLIITSWGFYGNLRTKQTPPYSAGTTIEIPDGKGGWKVVTTAGKSAGDSKTWAIDLSNKIPKSSSRMRITMAHLPSVLDVIDKVALDDSKPVKIKITKVYPEIAKLRFGGATKVKPSSLKNPIRAKDEKLPLIPEAYMKGKFTRFGKVKSLLQKSDDKFVIMAHGDEIYLEFKAPKPVPGKSRWVFMGADVFYTLKYHPYGKLTDSINPLPFHGMKTYPYSKKKWPYRHDQEYKKHLKKFQTRVHK
ncbi:MAG: hypothetical protein PF689_13025 [Deltaproteobacteria bacterium]|nr:hypothetical protein [Deltaproteobacteria bacterium]